MTTKILLAAAMLAAATSASVAAVDAPLYRQALEATNARAQVLVNRVQVEELRWFDRASDAGNGAGS